MVDYGLRSDFKQARKTSISNNGRLVTMCIVLKQNLNIQQIELFTFGNYSCIFVRLEKASKKFKYEFFLFQVQVQGRQNVGRVPEEEVRV